MLQIADADMDLATRLLIVDDDAGGGGVSRLRHKLQRSDGPKGTLGGDELIRTVRNEGYMFTADVTG